MGSADQFVTLTSVQDDYLTKNPEISFFKVQYRRHSRFQIDTVLLESVGGTANFGKQFTTDVAMKGDLLCGLHAEIDLPAVTAVNGETIAWTRNLGEVAFDELEITAGNQSVQTLMYRWITVHNALFIPPGKALSHAKMIGNTTALTTPSATLPATTLLVTFPFFFGSSIELAFPMTNLKRAPVRLRAKMAAVQKLLIGNPTAVPSLSDVRVYGEYVCLDTPERNDFESRSIMDYIIDVVQTEQVTVSDAAQCKVDLRLIQHPVRALYWTCQQQSNIDAKRLTDFSNSGTNASLAYAGGDTITSAKLILNSVERFAPRGALFYSHYQLSKMHSNAPPPGLYAIGFCLNPEKGQPNGSLNFTRVPNGSLNLDLASTNTYVITVYAWTSQILRFQAGGCAILYQGV